MNQIIQFLKQCQSANQTWDPADRAEKSWRNAQYNLRKAQASGRKALIRDARRQAHRAWVAVSYPNAA